MIDMFDMALEALEGVLSQKAARSCLEAGLNVQGKAIETASLEDYRAALRSNVFRQLQVVMPATAAAQLIREVEFQLEQLDNERTEMDSQRPASKPAHAAAVPQTMVDESKTTSIRDPDLLAMAGSNLLTLNLRSLGSLSVEFGDVLFAERDLKLEVRAIRRMLDEGQPVEREKIEKLRDTLRLRREILLVAQRSQLETLDHQIYDLSQRVVVPRELEARLESARRLLASGTLATSDLRQMERLVETVIGEPIVQLAPVAAVALESEPVFEPEPAIHEPAIQEPVVPSILDAESTSVFASELESEPIPALESRVVLEPEDEPVLVVEEESQAKAAVSPELEPVIPAEPDPILEPAVDFEPVWTATEESGSGVTQAEATLPAVVADSFEPVAAIESEAQVVTSAQSVLYGSWNASTPSAPVAELSAEIIPDEIDDVPSLESELELTSAESFEPVVSAQELHDFTSEIAVDADPAIASVLRPLEPTPDFEPEPELVALDSETEHLLEPITTPEPVAEVVLEPDEAVLEPEHTEIHASEPESAVVLEPEAQAQSQPEAISAVQDEPEITTPEITAPEEFTPESHLVAEPEAEEFEAPREARLAHEAPAEPEAEMLEPVETVVAEPEALVVNEAIEAAALPDLEATTEPKSAEVEPEAVHVSDLEPALEPHAQAIEIAEEPEAVHVPDLQAAPETEPTHDLPSEPEMEALAPEVEVHSEPEAEMVVPEAAAMLEAEAPEAKLEPEPEKAVVEVQPEPQRDDQAEPVLAHADAESHLEQVPEPVVEDSAIVAVEPESSLPAQPVPIIEADRGAWYAPSIATPHVPPVTHDETPVIAPNYITANSGFSALREENQVENEIVQEHVETPVPTQAITNAEEGIVWLASARRDASSRNADRLRKDPMALKPGRLESEHGLAEAEAHVLEAKLHAACDGAGLQHRRLEAEFALKVAQAAVELASKRVEAVSLRERYGAASKAELEHAQLELERAQEELALARLSEGVVPNVAVNGEPSVNRVEVDAERLKVALQSTPQMLSARHTLERAELELAIRDNPAYPASEIASVRNVVNQAREHFSTLEATLHAELEAALASMRYYGARMGEKDSAWKTAESELHHAEEGVRQGFVASLTRDEAQLKALRADSEKRKAAHKYLEAVHRLQCLTHQYMLG